MDLLFGLMLPSGNDAAFVLAENFGYILKLKKQEKHHLID
jgi:D-alanyl-D-alanine carboxypeptidase